MKQMITKRRLQVLLKYTFINFFEDNIRGDFSFFNWSMIFQQQSKKFGIFIEFDQKIFEIKERNFHN